MTIAWGAGTVIDQSGCDTIRNSKVYDAEIHGAMAALEAINSDQQRHEISIHILSPGKLRGS